VAQGANVRNGAGRKIVSTDLGSAEIRTPRDRDARSSGRVHPRRRPPRVGIGRRSELLDDLGVL
jgi:transposase-like protein